MLDTTNILHIGVKIGRQCICSTGGGPTRRAAATDNGRFANGRADDRPAHKRDVIYDRWWDKTRRVRNAVKGLYGDDSSEYEMVGGKRISERKPPVRKPKTA